MFLVHNVYAKQMSNSRGIQKRHFCDKATKLRKKMASEQRALKKTHAELLSVLNVDTSKDVLQRLVQRTLELHQDATHSLLEFKRSEDTFLGVPRSRDKIVTAHTSSAIANAYSNWTTSVLKIQEDILAETRPST